MQDIPLATAHLAQAVTTLALCWRLERSDGVLILGTEHDRDIAVTVDTTALPLTGVYSASAGITGSTVRSTSDMSVDNVEVTGAINQGELSVVDLSAADIEAGLFDDASVTLFFVNWENPDVFQVVLRCGTVGEISRTSDGQYRTELRGLAQRLAQSIGRNYGSSCDAEFGDVRCKKDVIALTITGVVTGVTDNRQFTTLLSRNSPEEDLGYFDGGLVTWTSGQNESFSMEVKVELTLPDPGPGSETLLAGASWLCPAGVTSVTVEAWGAGGGGGGNNNASVCGGAGGGGGAYSSSVVAVTPGNSYAYSIGTGGAGGVNANGSAGGDTTWDTSVVVAKGGSGGGRATLAPAGGAGGAGGLASAGTGDTKFDGGWGENGLTSGAGQGGWGGSSGGTASDGHANGAAASFTTPTYPTGSTPAGGGHGGNGAPNASSNGSSPVAGQYGGGGGGSGEGTARSGGAGAQGKIQLTYTVAVDDSLLLFLPMPYDIEVGDEFTLRPGCDKTMAMCKTRFDNLINFRGHGAWVPGIGEMMVFGGQTSERKPARPSRFILFAREVFYPPGTFP